MTSTTPQTMTSKLAQTYQKKTDKEHILDNPDTYTGSMECLDSQMMVFAAGSGGALGDTEATSFGFDVAAKTTAYVCADGTGNTVATATAGKVLVTIEYFGSAAPA